VTTALEAQLTGDYQQDLRAVGAQLLLILLERKDALRLMLCEATHFPDVQEVMVQNPRQIRLMLTKYLGQQIDKGRVRPLHPEVMAQAFLGMFFSYAIATGLLEDAMDPELSTEELLAQFVDIFVMGTIEQS
jgi:hypothetical protein